jgi:hypothetical protein
MTTDVGRTGGHPSSPRLLVLAIASTLCGCATPLPPPRPFLDQQIRDSGGVAYLWTAGKATQAYFSMMDYAVVIGIDNQALSPKYRPAAGVEPFVAWRIEVPVGRHVVQVLDKQQTLVCGYLGCLVMEHEIRLVEFTAEADRAYVPLAADKCRHKWIWIADAGAASPEGPTSRLLAFSDGLTTAGGESPPAESC